MCLNFSIFFYYIYLFFSIKLEEITNIIKFLTIIDEDKKEDRERLFYYYLKRMQKETVINIKSPNDKIKLKEFMGYESTERDKIIESNI